MPTTSADVPVQAPRPDDRPLPPGGLAGQVARGFAMGMADLVPGVSGGTIALALGIYTRLVAAVHGAARVAGRAARLDLRGAWVGLRHVDWAFLVPLLAGIGSAVLLLAGLLSDVLRRHPVQSSAVFSGLVLASVVVSVGDVRRWSRPRLLLLLTVTGVVAVALGIRGAPTHEPSMPALFLAGALAVCAMILPGISGSFVLLLLGLYGYVLAAVGGLDVAFLAVLAAGAGLGLGLFASLLDRLLREHHDTMLVILIGLMAGSMRVLWMWPAGEGVGDPRVAAPVAEQVPGVLLAAVVAFAGMLAAAHVARRSSRTG